MQKQLVLIMLSIIFFYSCSTTLPTFFDIDKSRIIENANKIYLDSNVSCVVAFRFLSNQNNVFKYSGLYADIIIERNITTCIENADIKISPSSLIKPIVPDSFRCSNINLIEKSSGADFSSIKLLFNKRKNEDFEVYFTDDMKNYDSLFLTFNLTYTIDNKTYSVLKDNAYIKGSFKRQFTR